MEFESFLKWNCSQSYLQNVPLTYLKNIEDCYKKTFLPEIKWVVKTCFLRKLFNIFWGNISFSHKHLKRGDICPNSACVTWKCKGFQWCPSFKCLPKQRSFGLFCFLGKHLSCWPITQPKPKILRGWDSTVQSYSWLLKSPKTNSTHLLLPSTGGRRHWVLEVWQRAVARAGWCQLPPHEDAVSFWLAGCVFMLNCKRKISHQLVKSDSHQRIQTSASVFRLISHKYAQELLWTMQRT